MWTMAFSCSLVAVASAFWKRGSIFCDFVFFGLGGFIILRYLGYFRFEFFGQGLTTLIKDRKSTQSVEQSIKEAEQIVANGGEICVFGILFGQSCRRYAISTSENQPLPFKWKAWCRIR